MFPILNRLPTCFCALGATGGARTAAGKYTLLVYMRTDPGGGKCAATAPHVSASIALPRRIGKLSVTEKNTDYSESRTTDCMRQGFLVLD